MKEVTVTVGKSARVWWSITWRTALLVALISIPCSIVFMMFAMGSGNDEPPVWISNVLGLVLGVPVGIWVTKGVLEKRFNGFRIALIEDGANENESTRESDTPA